MPGIEAVIGWLMTGKDITVMVIDLLSPEESAVKIVAEGHRKSAMQAMSAARHDAYMSAAYKRHLSEGRAHLRDCFNLLMHDAQRPNRGWNWVEEHLGGQDVQMHRRMAVYEEATKIGAMICDICKRLGDRNEAGDWLARTLDAFDKYANFASASYWVGDPYRRGGDMVTGLKSSKELDEERRHLRSGLEKMTVAEISKNGTSRYAANLRFGR